MNVCVCVCMQLCHPLTSVKQLDILKTAEAHPSLISIFHTQLIIFCVVGSHFCHNLARSLTHLNGF